CAQGSPQAAAPRGRRGTVLAIRGSTSAAHFLSRWKGERRMRQVARVGVLLPAMLLIVSGCASKNWGRNEMGQRDAGINQRMAKVEDRVGEESQRVDKRVDGVEGRVNQEAQRVDGVTTRVGGLETSITSTSEAARDARQRADAAQAKADAVDG